MCRALKIGVLTLVEWAFLLALWMCFVSQIRKDELLVGVAAAAIGVVADAVVKAEGFAKFSPKASWLALIAWEPWYALDGTWATLKAIARNLAGLKSQAQFKVASFDAGCDDAQSAAKRALAVTYMTIPPNFIVVGIDRQHKQVLIHQVEPTPNPLIAQRLGIHE
jgi:multisubunit Na+/H+ antiporter MnhE subunit